MRAHLVVVSRPSLAFSAHLVETQEPVGIEGRSPEFAVQAFDEGVVGRLAGGSSTWIAWPGIRGYGAAVSICERGSLARQLQYVVRYQFIYRRRDDAAVVRGMRKCSPRS